MTLEEAKIIGDIVASVINKSSHAGCESCQENATEELQEKFPEFYWSFKEVDYKTVAEVLNGSEV
jgi:hypothetical protein